jgi:glycosyltransferase involved in cell wall biosynthesis
MSHNKIFITWAPSNTRSSSLANALSFEPIFIGKINKHDNSIQALFNYIGRTITNIKLVYQEKPKYIAISNFHWIIALVNLILSRLINAHLILDSHSAAFDHPFYKYPKFLSYYIARKSLFSIVTNEVHQNLLQKKGAKAIVLPDIPNEAQLSIENVTQIDDKFNICFICTFNYDEPYSEVLEAAKQLENTTIHITGKYANKISDPENHPNVVFTGYLSDEDFIYLINQVDAILVLTTRENTMQSGGSEAISVAKPLITSDTQMLRNYFKLGTVFVKSDSQSILNGIKNLIQDYENLKKEMTAFRILRKQNFSNSIQQIQQQIEK